jgi:hypothetical protein
MRDGGRRLSPLLERRDGLSRRWPYSSVRARRPTFFVLVAPAVRNRRDIPARYHQLKRGGGALRAYKAEEAGVPGLFPLVTVKG